MAKHGIVRTDNLHGTKDGADLVSIRYKESSANVAIDNGNFCTIGAYETGEREVRVGGKPAANTSIHNLCLIASEELTRQKLIPLSAISRTRLEQSAEATRLILTDSSRLRKKHSKRCWSNSDCWHFYS